MKLPLAFLRVSRFGQTRRLLRALEAIADAEQQQVLLLARLVAKFAPDHPAVAVEDLRTTGSSFARDEELAKVQDFTEQVRKDLKRDPTDDEIIDFLDGKMSQLR